MTVLDALWLPVLSTPSISNTETAPSFSQPWTTGKVERSHRVDGEEFWRRHQFSAFEAATTALRVWERTYNVDRFSMALGGETPAEKLARLLPAFQVA
jgi:transposase InsO family protein